MSGNISELLSFILFQRFDSERFILPKYARKNSHRFFLCLLHYVIRYLRIRFIETKFKWIEGSSEESSVLEDNTYEFLN